MKVLGLSFGSKNGNCDIVVKQALWGAQAQGAEIRFVNTVNLKLDRCTGCGACNKRRAKGGPSRCIIKDDFPFIENEILDADAIVVAAPVYVLGPVGQYKNLCDRLGPSHGRAVMVMENERRAATGMEPLDSRLFTDRFVGLISVGGARTENWTSLGLSGMYLLTIPMQMTVVDQINLYAMGDRAHPAFDAALMERLAQMGKNVASVVGTPRQDAPYFGDDEGVCPTCHCDLLTVKGTTDVQCPVCGTHGTLSVKGDKVSVYFSPEQLDHTRTRYDGLREHSLEIMDMGKVAMAKMERDGDTLPDLMAHLGGITEVDGREFVENPNK